MAQFFNELVLIFRGGPSWTLWTLGGIFYSICYYFMPTWHGDRYHYRAEDVNFIEWWRHEKMLLERARWYKLQENNPNLDPWVHKELFGRYYWEPPLPEKKPILERIQISLKSYFWHKLGEKQILWRNRWKKFMSILPLIKPEKEERFDDETKK